MQKKRLKYTPLKKIKLNSGSLILPAIWEKLDIPKPIPEYKFYLHRKWRIDYAWPEILLAVEIEGGIFSGGRHIHPTGFIKDMEKYNKMTECGYYLLRYTPNKIDFKQIKRTIENINNRYK